MQLSLEELVEIAIKNQPIIPFPSKNARVPSGGIFRMRFRILPYHESCMACTALSHLSILSSSGVQSTFSGDSSMLFRIFS